MWTTGYDICEPYDDITFDAHKVFVPTNSVCIDVRKAKYIKLLKQHKVIGGIERTFTIPRPFVDVQIAQYPIIFHETWKDVKIDKL